MTIKTVPSYVMLERQAPPPRLPDPRFQKKKFALREIHKYQGSTNILLRKAPFARLVREIAEPHMENVRFQAQLFKLFKKLLRYTNLLVIYGKRVTIQPKDMEVVRRIRKEYTLYCSSHCVTLLNKLLFN
ncbi:hypothetical protein PsorP6_006199 [Peronosclerospora sorghi]|uniref:Uncharacterized protein n=1 Tax=Peronosclerospora sorghi TaxID=230839 RepID=A0ACC0W738_9STRA|nr:hypothetical protein PsorP6_006199 [Peronosclerospora sorghi]